MPVTTNVANSHKEPGSEQQPRKVDIIPLAPYPGYERLFAK